MRRASVKIPENQTFGVVSVLRFVVRSGLAIVIASCTVLCGCSSKTPDHGNSSIQSQKAILLAVVLGCDSSAWNISQGQNRISIENKRGDQLLLVDFDGSNIKTLHIVKGSEFGHYTDYKFASILDTVLDLPEVQHFIRRDCEMIWSDNLTSYRIRFRGRENMTGDYLIITIDKKSLQLHLSAGR